MRFAAAAALAAVASVSGQEIYLGFNSGATTDKKVLKTQADFEKEFASQQKLNNAPGTFNSVRLYTNIQGDTTEPIEAFPAAIKTKTKLLLGLWVSGANNLDKELNALDKAIKKYGKDFTDLVVGISVGSEDLYRVSKDGVDNKSGVGVEATELVSYIENTRNKLKGTALASAPIGHVDTWTAWSNSSNKAVVDAVDWVGVDMYPYYEKTKDNHIDNAETLFDTALNATEDAAGDKPVWITETGWPITGDAWGKAVPSSENAKKYWDAVGCKLFGKTNTWWYIQRDSNPDNTMKFAVNPQLNGSPAYDLTCPAKKSGSSGSATSSSSEGGSSTTVAQATGAQSAGARTSGSSAEQTGAASKLVPTAMAAIAGLSLMFAIVF